MLALFSMLSGTYYAQNYASIIGGSLEDTEAVLLVDADNAFNRIKCQAALHNINILCPSFSTIS